MKTIRLTKSVLTDDRLDLFILFGLASLLTLVGITGTLFDISRVVWDEPTITLLLDDVEGRQATDGVETLGVLSKAETSRTVFTVHHIGVLLENFAVTATAACIALLTLSALKKTPFGPESYQKLRISGTMMVVGFVGSFLRFIVIDETFSAVETQQENYSAAWIAAAAVFFGLSKIWSYIDGLRSEAELTI